MFADLLILVLAALGAARLCEWAVGWLRAVVRKSRVIRLRRSKDLARGLAPATLWRCSAAPWSAERATGLPWICDPDGRAMARQRARAGPAPTPRTLPGLAGVPQLHLVERSGGALD